VVHSITETQNHKKTIIIQILNLFCSQNHPIWGLQVVTFGISQRHYKPQKVVRPTKTCPKN
jgi:hypothetical protein